MKNISVVWWKWNGGWILIGWASLYGRCSIIATICILMVVMRLCVTVWAWDIKIVTVWWKGRTGIFLVAISICLTGKRVCCFPISSVWMWQIRNGNRSVFPILPGLILTTGRQPKTVRFRCIWKDRINKLMNI